MLFPFLIFFSLLDKKGVGLYTDLNVIPFTYERTNLMIHKSNHRSISGTSLPEEKIGRFKFDGLISV